MEGTNDIHGVAYENGQFVALGNGIGTSPDGISWTRTNLDISGPLTSVAYGNGTFVVVGSWMPSGLVVGKESRGLGIASSSALVMTSGDGQNWTSQDLPISGRLTAVDYGSAGFVAVGTTSEPQSVVLTSPTGVSSSLEKWDGWPVNTVTWTPFHGGLYVVGYGLSQPLD